MDYKKAKYMTYMQKKKLNDLIAKGGYVLATTYHVKMPDGSEATIDKFGNVKWWTR